MIKTGIASMESTESARNVENGRGGWYTNCISLGGGCGVAASMSHYGLRNHAGPIDCYFLNMEPVLKLMEPDLKDFIAKKICLQTWRIR